MPVGYPAGMATGRKTVDACRITAVVAHASVRQVLECGDVNALSFQDSTLGGAAKDITTQAPVAPSNPVAGNQERDGVALQGRAYGAYSAWVVDLMGDPGIRPHFSAWDLAYLL
jgi:hypothetical protein